jgi:hypothetical protein
MSMKNVILTGTYFLVRFLAICDDGLSQQKAHIYLQRQTNIITLQFNSKKTSFCGACLIFILGALSFIREIAFTCLSLHCEGQKCGLIQ